MPTFIFFFFDFFLFFFGKFLYNLLPKISSNTHATEQASLFFYALKTTS